MLRHLGALACAVAFWGFVEDVSVWRGVAAWLSVVACMAILQSRRRA
jgi:hypothetical protein